MSWLGAILLLAGGLFGVLGSWLTARPIGDPTRRYSPAWLPAMIVSELALLWLLVHGGVVALGLAMGGWRNWGGRIGVVLLTLSAAMAIGAAVRGRLGARRLRRHVDGPIHRAPGFAGLVGRPIPTPGGVVERHRITWHGALTLDLTRPDDDRPELPVLVYVHGGGWTGGDPQRQARDLYHTLARGGWATVAIRYPFAPDATVERQIATVRSAVRWVRTGLTEHGVSASHVALAGGSAGGHLAAMATLTGREDERVAACVGIYGIYDMANRHRMRAPWGSIPNTVMGVRYADAPHRYRAVSPIDQDVGASPPFLLVHGTRDTLVPIGEAEQFAAVLRAADRPVDLVPVSGAEHAFDAVSGTASRTAAAVIRDWLRRTVG